MQDRHLGVDEVAGLQGLIFAVGVASAAGCILVVGVAFRRRDGQQFVADGDPQVARSDRMSVPFLPLRWMRWPSSQEQ